MYLQNSYDTGRDLCLILFVLKKGTFRPIHRCMVQSHMFNCISIKNGQIPLFPSGSQKLDMDCLHIHVVNIPVHVVLLLEVTNHFAVKVLS